MSVSDSLNRFGKRVVKEARTALTKKKKNVSKELYNSINYKFTEHKNSFHLAINMADYGKFIDKGVQGKKDNSKAPRSPFKYTTKRPPAKVFDKWSIKRGIAPRNKKGQFTSRKAVNFAIANAVYNYGIEETLFLTKPFESAFKSLPDEIIEAYGLEIDKFLSDVTV